MRTLVIAVLLLSPLFANAADYTAAQCGAIEGAFSSSAAGCGDIGPGYFSVGNYLNTSCQVSGVCCALSATPPPPGGACGAQTCTAIGGECRVACGGAFGTPGGGTCSSGQCCIPGGGGTCVSQGGICTGSLTTTCASELRKSSSGTCSTTGQNCCTTATFPSCTSPNICSSNGCGAGTENTNSICTNASQRCCAPAPQTQTGLTQPSTQTGLTQPNSAPGVTLINPLQGGGNLETFLINILRFVVRIGAIIVVLMYVFVGFKFVAAQGEPGKITEARTMLLWTTIGALVLLGAEVIARGIQATVQSLTSGG